MDYRVLVVDDIEKNLQRMAQKGSSFYGAAKAAAA